MKSYMNVLSNVHRQIADARKCHWKVSVPSVKAIEELYDADFLQCFLDELGLSKNDKKWCNNLQLNHMKITSLLHVITRPDSELSPDEMESCLKAIQSNIEGLWNTIQFQIYFRNSERGLVPKGLKNHGNTCYFNSVIQCLFQTVLLVFEMTLSLYGRGNVSKEFTLSEAYMELVSKCSESEQRNRALKNLYQMFTRVAPRFSDGRQHDSHELLLHFLDRLRSEEISSWKSLRVVGDETPKLLSAVDKIFGGQLITVYTCHSCEEPYAIREPFLDISLPLCTLTSDDNKQEQSKDKSIKSFMSELIAATRSESTSGQKRVQQNPLGTSEAGPQQIPFADARNYAECRSSSEVNHSSSPPVDGNCNALPRREGIMKKTITVKYTVKAEDGNCITIEESDFINKPQQGKSKSTTKEIIISTSNKSASNQASEQQNSLGYCEAKLQNVPREKAESHSSFEVNLLSSLPFDYTSNALPRREVIKNMMKTLTGECTAEAEAKSLYPRGVLSWFSKPQQTLHNVSQCFQYFIRAEKIDCEYLCRNCQPPGSDEPLLTSATKRTLISSPPAVLVLHLKRFEQMPIVGFVKRDETIPYEELLDLGPFCSCSAQRIDPEEENVWYSLYAVVVHYGKFLSQGHYIAYVKERDSSALLEDHIMDKFLQKKWAERENIPNDDDIATMEKRKRIAERKKTEPPDPIRGQWYYCSDELVRPCHAKEALDQKAFLLFYERIPGFDR